MITSEFKNLDQEQSRIVNVAMGLLAAAEIDFIMVVFPKGSSEGAMATGIGAERTASILTEVLQAMATETAATHRIEGVKMEPIQ